jgi:hypothetical protein
LRGEISKRKNSKGRQGFSRRGGSASNAAQEEADWKRLEEVVKKKLDGLTPQMVEERYDYLSTKPISELTDAEYEERLALAEKLSERANKKTKKQKTDN